MKSPEAITNLSYDYSYMVTFREDTVFAEHFDSMLLDLPVKESGYKVPPWRFLVAEDKIPGLVFKHISLLSLGRYCLNPPIVGM